MTRKCGTCQHIKRAEIDRRLAAGEPGNQIARDYELNPSSLHRHRTNCLNLGCSNAIMKEVSRGTAAITCLPSKDELNNAYFELRARIDEIVSQAEQQGSLAVAISGLNSIRHTLDSLSRLAGYDRAGTQVNVAVQTNLSIGPIQIAERLIQHFDHKPELKAEIAQALMEMDHEPSARGFRHDPDFMLLATMTKTGAPCLIGRSGYEARITTMSIEVIAANDLTFRRVRSSSTQKARGPTA